MKQTKVIDFACRITRIAVLCSVVLLLLSACSKPWKAPHESRSEGRTSSARIISSQQKKRATEKPSRSVGSTKSSVKTHTVRSGDTLYSIGRLYGVNHRQLLQWNGLKNSHIHQGQRLRLQSSVAVSESKSHSVNRQVTKEPVVQQTAASSEPIPNAPTKLKENLRWRWPTKGRVTQTFLPTDSSRKGIKISGSEGRTIRAAEAGTVVYSGNGLVGYGELVIIKHNKNYLSAYAYNRKRLVKEGDKVKSGAAIAEMGINGGEPLLHFEIRRKGKPVDPLAYLPRK